MTQDTSTGAAAELSKAGYQLLKNGDFAAARAKFESILEFDAANSYALVGIGESERRQGNFEAAIDAYEECLRHHDGNRYALVGMAAVFAASAHAPIPAVIILFELTGDYRIILPLMLTVVISTLVSELILRGESIYTLKLSRRGVHLKRGRDVDILQGVTVGEAMTEGSGPVR